MHDPPKILSPSPTVLGTKVRPTVKKTDNLKKMRKSVEKQKRV